MTRIRKYQGVCLKTGNLIQGTSLLVYDEESGLAKPGENVFIMDGYGHTFNIIPDSAGDFTGEQDINGQDLYEHDTFRSVLRDWVVIFDQGCFCAAPIVDGVVDMRQGTITLTAIRSVFGKVKTGNIYIKQLSK